MALERMAEKIVETDVLVVGGGGAGTMAAIKATVEGVKVLVVTKGPFPSGNTSIAMGGFAAALGHSDSRDNPQVHFQDALKAGKGLNNRKLLRTWVTNIIEITREMDSWGIDLIREGDKFIQRPQEGHTYPRLLHHYDTTGKAITQCLSQKIKDMGIPSLEYTIIGGLLKEDEKVAGAWGIQYQTGELILVKAKAIVLATGGLGQLYPITDNIKTITGEGYTLAFRAGAELIQMEFCHFLTTPCYPDKLKASFTFLISINNLINSGGARLFNALGERFMKKQFPNTWEQGKSGEELTRAIGLEICEGKGGPHGGAYLDVSDIPLEMQKTAYAKIWKIAARAGVDLSYQPVELAPHPHDMIGGVLIDETGSTTVQGLFAAGEAAGGSHGASRLTGSALADALVFGGVSGKNAARYARQSGQQSPLKERQHLYVRHKIESLLATKEGIKPSELKRDIQIIANNYLSVVRSEEGLKRALQELERIEREKLPQLSAWASGQKERSIRLREVIEVDGQVELAKIIAMAALLRQESRGGYYGGSYRSDYPFQDDKKWLTNIILKREPDGVISHRTASPVMED